MKETIKDYSDIKPDYNNLKNANNHHNTYLHSVES